MQVFSGCARNGLAVKKIKAVIPKAYFLLGKLNPSSEDENLKAGTNLELPFWLIQPLLERRQQILSADLPKVYTELYREIFKADATVIDMRKFNIYYYELGQYIKKIDPRGEVAEVLFNVSVFKTKKMYLT